MFFYLVLFWLYDGNNLITKSMAILERITRKSEDFKPNDKGVSVKKALELLDEKYYKRFYEELEISKIEDEFIAISGANSLVNAVLKLDKLCTKFDVQSASKNVKMTSLLDKREANIKISDIDDREVNVKAKKIIGRNYIEAKTRYSVKSDYLDGLCQVDKFFNQCLNVEYKDVIDLTYKMLEEKNKDNESEKNYRLISDDKGQTYIRAITSINQYEDYNVKFSVFIALISLHRIMKDNKGDNYEIKEYSIGDSDIRVIFSKIGQRELGNKTKIGFALELINDEIKREAIKFHGIFNISFEERTKNKDLFIKPDITQSTAKILSFAHRPNIDLPSILGKLNDRIKLFEEEIYVDIERIKSTKSHDKFREYLYNKVNSSKNTEFNEKYKSQAKDILMTKVNNLYGLLDAMNKVYLLIADDDIQAKDFWRMKLYEVIIKGKKFED